MKQVYFDIRLEEWTTADMSYNAPELYFAINVSDDGVQHHVFATDKGDIEIATNDKDEFAKLYENYSKDRKILYRKEWKVSKDYFEQGCKYYGIEM